MQQFFVKFYYLTRLSEYWQLTCSIEVKNVQLQLHAYLLQFASWLSSTIKPMNNYIANHAVKAITVTIIVQLRVLIMKSPLQLDSGVDRTLYEDSITSNSIIYNTHATH